VLPEGWRDTRATAACATTLRRFVERELGGSPLGGVKDPRLCRLVPLWLDLLPELGIEPAVVVAVRDPRQVAASLTARDGLERTHAEQLWLVDMLEAERLTRAVSRTFVGYEQLLADWRGAALRVAGELELAWPRSPERAAPAVDAFLSADLSHQRTATGQLAPRVATAAVLFAEAADGSPLRVHELDRLRDEIRSTSDLLTPLAEAPPRVEQARSGIGNRARGAVRRVRRS
jgi:hypothetical protein